MVKKVDILKDNADALNRELAWLEQVMNVRLELYFGQDCAYKSIWDIQLPDLKNDNSSYAAFIKQHESSPAERLILMLLLAPHVKPQLLDVFLVKNTTYDKGFTEFGGLKGAAHGGFLPTVETALFMLAGDDLYLRIQALALFDHAHEFMNSQIIQLFDAAYFEPHASSSLVLSPIYVHYFLTGIKSTVSHSKDFPAKLISTGLEWADLVLPADTLIQLEEIQAWIRHHDTLVNDWGFGKKIRPGYKSLFYGPPGTGKTLAASLIGKLCDLDVYRIDLSLIVSKYIGETEKNLEKVFQLAENKNWILFFDEADALFGKRTSVSNANDRYANQETAYLLQRIDDFSGVVILASNLRNNIDEAFARRFQSLIYFSIPQAQERLKLWRQSMSQVSTLEEGIDLKVLAKKHELTGGMIMNIVRYCSLMSVNRGEYTIRLSDVERGIQKELLKEGRIM
jgi:hypothetical protein